jgi:hypothetical protein
LLDEEMDSVEGEEVSEEEYVVEEASERSGGDEKAGSVSRDKGEECVRYC